MTADHWQARDGVVTAHWPHRPALVLDRGEGCHVWDVDGRRYLDFESGQFCMATGHSHPQVGARLGEQAARLMQIGNRFTCAPRVRLAEKLAELAPDPLARAIFCSTGSEAVETAIRLAKLVTGRFELVSLMRGYHGRTSGSFALSSAVRRLRRGDGPSAPGVTAVAPPYALRCPFECGGCDLRCWRHSLEVIDRSSSGAPAAVIVEPVIGAGGIIPVDSAWLREVRAFCDQRGALLIADETLTGLGRTGRWFAFEHLGVVPDIVVLAKALGGGVPAAAILTTDDVADEALARRFVQASSHQGDPFQCAAALATIEVIEAEDLLANARAMGRLLQDGLEQLVARHAIAGEARGVGLIRGLEIVDGGAETWHLASEVSRECLRRGLIVGGIRPGLAEGNTLRLGPPLIVGPAHIGEALGVLDEALAHVGAAARGTGPLPSTSHPD